MNSQPDMQAKFTRGSTMRHIMVMTTTSAIGLMGIFLVDLLDMYFLSLLDDEAILAGVGFGSTLAFFTVSLGIGLTISMAALVSRSIGSNNTQQARHYVVNTLTLIGILCTLAIALIYPFIDQLLALIGAEEAALVYGSQYLHILFPSFPILAMGMALGAALRAVGDAKLSMWSTLIGGAVNAILDPILIFTFELGIEGAAIASVVARVTMLAVAFYGVFYKHRLFTRFIWNKFKHDLRGISHIAFPAVLTNMVTPFGNAVVMAAIADFGASAVAGFSVISRLNPVAFGLVFALSGAVAPIIGQNYGAKAFHRIRSTLYNAQLFNAGYVIAVSALLFLLQDHLVAAFKLDSDGAMLMQVFCTYIAISFIFNGAQFIANASFNNLGKPMYATTSNALKATLGTIPFVYFGAQWGDAAGVIIGQALGGMITAIIAVWVAFRLIKRIEAQASQSASTQSSSIIDKQ